MRSVKFAATLLMCSRGSFSRQSAGQLSTHNCLRLRLEFMVILAIRCRRKTAGLNRESLVLWATYSSQLEHLACSQFYMTLER